MGVTSYLLVRIMAEISDRTASERLLYRSLRPVCQILCRTPWKYQLSLLQRNGYWFLAGCKGISVCGDRTLAVTSNGDFQG